MEGIVVVGVVPVEHPRRHIPFLPSMRSIKSFERSSTLTRRWSEADSNHRSPSKKAKSFETTLIACGPFSSPKITAKPREGDRWFECSNPLCSAGESAANRLPRLGRRNLHTGRSTDFDKPTPMKFGLRVCAGHRACAVDSNGRWRFPQTVR
jgi:hypothetical protein